MAYILQKINMYYHLIHNNISLDKLSIRNVYYYPWNTGGTCCDETFCIFIFP